MARKDYTPEQAIGMLREAEALTALILRTTVKLEEPASPDLSIVPSRTVLQRAGARSPHVAQRPGPLRKRELRWSVEASWRSGQGGGHGCWSWTRGTPM